VNYLFDRFALTGGQSKMNLESHRPPGFVSKGDHYLLSMAMELKSILIKTEKSLAHNSLSLPDSKYEQLAGLLVEFGEDIHNNIGMWKSLEQYNVTFFGTPLPFVGQSAEGTSTEPINEQRVQHLLWVIYSELNPQLIISPTHGDLMQMAAVVADFLKRRFTKIPRGSSIKKFLSQPNRFGWDVKKKLFWMGTHSYLFRNSFRNYIDDHGGKDEIPVIDDFICQQTTNWSGLGVIDILASALDISEEQLFTLRSWYERYLAYYRIMTIESDCMKVINAINDKPYRVRFLKDTNQFEVGWVVLGSLVPWGGEWYWSGRQIILGDIGDNSLQEVKKTFLQKHPQIAYRYCSELEEKAKQMVNLQYDKFVKSHGNDLVIYPNGLSMAADWQKEIRLQWESKPKEVIAEVMKKSKLKEPRADIRFSRDFLESENEVGVYCNPEEGLDVMTGFNHIISGFKKKGLLLSTDEEEGIRAFIFSEVISPNFVKRLIQEYGYEFLIRGGQDASNLEYLLRRYKGDYYRKRHPRMALV
jgi:hypothetical protein